MNLFGSQQIRQGIYNMPLDGSLQVPRPVSLVRAFLQQELFARPGYAEQELALGRL
jgi:hypothetical protein